MTRIIWMLFLLGAYFWVVSSGREETIIRHGKAIYHAIVEWFDGADADFQLKEEKKSNRKPRRWS